MMNKSIALLLLIAAAGIAGCSHPTPADSASASNTTASTSSVSKLGIKDYIDVRNELEITFNDDGTALVKDHQNQKSVSVPWSITSDRYLQLNGLELRRVAGGVWAEEGGGHRLVPADDASRSALEKHMQELKALADADAAPRPAWSAYRPVPLGDFAFLASSRVPSPTDEDIANALIPGYGTAPDAFKKHDLLQQNLAAVKAKLADFAKHNDYVVEFDEEIPTFRLATYDFPTHSFRLKYGPCNEPPPGYEHVSVARIANIPVAFQLWEKPGDPSCQLVVPDESTARLIEQNAATLQAHIKMYFRFTGKTQFTSSSGGDTILLDVSRLELSLLYWDSGGPDRINHPFPNTYVLSY